MEVIFAIFVLIPIALVLFFYYVGELRSYVVIREVVKILAPKIQQRIISNTTKEQFDCIHVNGGSISFEPWNALGFSSEDLKYRRKNGGEVRLGNTKREIKMAKCLISALNLYDYTYVCKREAYVSSNEYTSTVTGTSNGVEVKTSPSVSRYDVVIICRRDRVDEFAPKKKKTYYL